MNVGPTKNGLGPFRAPPPKFPLNPVQIYNDLSRRRLVHLKMGGGLVNRKGESSKIPPVIQV